MKQKPKHWSSFELRVAEYYANYFKCFLDLNTDFKDNLKETLFPPFLEIFGKHNNNDAIHYDNCFDAASSILNLGSDYSFSILSESVINDRTLRREMTQKFSLLFVDFLKEYRLFQDGFSEVANNTLAQRVLFAISVGDIKGVFIAGAYLPPVLSKELREELWGSRPKSEWIEFHKWRFRELGISEDLQNKFLSKDKNLLPVQLPPNKTSKKNRFRYRKYYYPKNTPKYFQFKIFSF